MGKVLNALQEIGRDRNTIVTFVGDHGFHRQHLHPNPSITLNLSEIHHERRRLTPPAVTRQLARLLAALGSKLATVEQGEYGGVIRYRIVP